MNNYKLLNFDFPCNENKLIKTKKTYKIICNFKTKDLIFDNKKILLKGYYLDKDTAIFLDKFEDKIKHEIGKDIGKSVLFLATENNNILTKILKNDILSDIGAIDSGTTCVIKAVFSGVNIRNDKYSPEWECRKITIH
jgi:hypothetical protein